MSRLTANYMQGIYQGGGGGGKMDGICQVIKIDRRDQKTYVELSDGSNFLPFVVPNRVAGHDQIKINSVIHLMSYTINNSGSYIVIKMDIRHHEGERIGSPQPLILPQSYTPQHQGQNQFNNQYSSERHPAQQRNQYNNNNSGGNDEEDLSIEFAQPFCGLRNGEDFVIHVRVIEKGDIRHWNKGESQGSVASLELLDEDNRTIEAALFNEAIDLNYQGIQVNHTYVMTGGRVKQASRYSRSSQSITFGQSMRMKEVPDTGRIPRSDGANYTKLSKLSSLGENTILDVCGIVGRIEEPRTFNRRDGSGSTKQDVLIIGPGANSNSFCSVNMTFWGDKLQNDLQRLEKGKAIGLKNVKKRGFLGCSLSSYFKTQILALPSDKETALNMWLRQDRDNQNEISLSQGRTVEGKVGGGMGSSNVYVEVGRLEEMTENNQDGNRIYCFVRGHITAIAKSKDMWYVACGNQKHDGKNCMKKVEDDGRGGYQCGRCNSQSPNAERRYMMNFRISDHTGVQWVTGFDEVGKQMFGHTAEEMNTWKVQDDQQFNIVVDKPMYKEYLYRCGCEIRQDESYGGLKVTVNSIYPIDHARAAKKSLRFIKMHEQDE